MTLEQHHAGRRFLVVAVAIASVLGTGPAVTAQTASRPNILWISTEDLSPRIGAYGDDLARTPNLDQLARDGVLFSNAFVTAPVCAPARAAIITGMYQNAIGAQHMRTTEDRFPELPGPYLAVPPFYVKAFPEYLRAAGYYATNNVKTDYQFGNPFTIWDESSNTAHWRNRPDPDQPFFAVFNITTTHESRTFPNDANLARPLVTDPNRVQVPPYYPDTRPVREELARHYDNVAEMDQTVGGILRQLEEDGLAENTIVFFWSDHGDGLPRAKRTLYDSGMHSILMVRWPERLAPPFAPGTVDSALVSFIDLAPTVLSLAGVEVPVHMQGRVFLGSGKQPAPSYVFGARDRMDMEYDMMRSARDDRFLYIRNFNSELPYIGHILYRNQSGIMQELLRVSAEGTGTGAVANWLQPRKPVEELYDVRSDPHQIRNLAGDPANRETLERMRGAVREWMARIDDQGRINEPEMIQRMWPAREQPLTATPYIMKRGRTPEQTSERGAAQTISGPVEVEIYVPTQGASIGYTLDEGDNPRWQLYSGPIRLTGPATIRARAIRYGYRESEEARAVFTSTAATSAGE